jgi:hypothetical protein
MALLVEEDEAPNSVDIGTFGANTIVFETNGMTDEIEEFRLVVHRVPSVKFRANFA